MEVTITVDGRHGRRGSGINPDSYRQRIRAACKEILATGVYPTMPMLRAAVPEASDSSISQHRWGVMKEIGLVAVDQQVTVDLSKI